MAGAPAGGAELFFERLTAAQHAAGDAILPLIRRDPARAARLTTAGLIPLQFPFGGALDFLTRPRLRAAELGRHVDGQQPQLAQLADQPGR